MPAVTSSLLLCIFALVAALAQHNVAVSKQEQTDRFRTQCSLFFDPRYILTDNHRPLYMVPRQTLER